MEAANTELTALVAATDGDKKVGFIQQKHIELLQAHKYLERDFAKMKRKYELVRLTSIQGERRR